MNSRHLALAVVVAVACVIMSAATAVAGPAPEIVSFHEAEKYATGDVVIPFESFESPLGATDSVTVALPLTYDPKVVQHAFLWLTVNDIDSKDEATISLNGQALAIPDELIAVGRGHKGFIQLDISSLRAGPNELRLTLTDKVTASNKGGIVIGCSIESAAIVLVRPGMGIPQPASTERDMYLTMIPGVGNVRIRDSSIEDTKMKMFHSKGLVWEEHPVLKVAGKNKWSPRAGEFRFLKTLKRTQIAPCGLAQMDNGEIILLGEIVDGDSRRIVVSFSKDNGDTWSDWNIIPKVNGEPAMLRYLGNGNLCFDAGVRWFSADYGRTWFDANSAKGRRWQERYSIPDSSEGSLVRARNGWLVKAFCQDLPDQSGGSMKSLGYSISKDNGKTWSPFKVLFEAGRTDPNLLLMPNGDLVMTYAVNQDMIDGDGPASYWHGSEAIVSKDNGRTWQVGRKYILDGMEFAHPAKGLDVMIYGHVCSTAMNNGQVLTVAGSIIPSKAPTTHWPTVDYMTKNINMVRWKP